MEKYSIVLIEDDPNWQIDLSNMLKSLNASIECFSDFALAEERIKSKIPYNLLITDIYPENSVKRRGLDFAKYANLIAKVPVIIVTVDSDMYTTEESLKNCKVNHIFYKDKFDALRFVIAVKEALTDSFKYDQERLSIKLENHVDVKFLQEIVGSSLSKILSSYTNQINGELNKMFDLPEISGKIDELAQGIILALEEIAHTNEVARLYYNEIIRAQQEDNKTILENKLKLSLAIIPGVLNLEPKWDLQTALHNLSKIYDKISFPVYKKLAEMYYSMKSN